MQRKINLLLVLFSLIGGAIGFAVGELILTLLGDLPSYLVIAIYFGSLAFFVGIFCLIAEMIAPRLNGASWRQRYVGTSWKMLLPVTFVLLFIVGMGLEALYQLNLGGIKPVKDIVLVIDDSGSMQQTDPNQDRYQAAKQFVDKMDSDNNVAVITFDNTVKLIQPFIQVKNNTVKNEVNAKIDALQPGNGGTNIELALNESMQQIEDKGSSDQKAMVILLSDGFSDLDMNATLTPYTDKQIHVNTIGLSLVDPQGATLLKDIAAYTGGQYYDVTNANDLSLVFQQIYNDLGERTLVTERSDNTENSLYYQIFHIIALLVIGLALGLSLGLLFDNRHLARSFSVGGAIAGLLAGLILEFGLSGHGFTDAMVRLLAALVLAGTIGLFSWIIRIQEHQRLREDRHRPIRTRGNAEGFSDRSKQQTNRGF